jgi:hypothetical protein
VIVIEDLDDDAYEVLQPIPVDIGYHGKGGVVAAWTDVTAMTGDTFEEALEGLSESIKSTFDHLTTTPDEKLGPRPRIAKQLLLQHVKFVGTLPPHSPGRDAGDGEGGSRT